MLCRTVAERPRWRRRRERLDAAAALTHIPRREALAALITALGDRDITVNANAQQAVRERLRLNAEADAMASGHLDPSSYRYLARAALDTAYPHDVSRRSRPQRRAPPLQPTPPAMIYVEAPHPYQPHPGDGPSIFLAGGITGCEDWQHHATALLSDLPVVIFNPRRAVYDPDAIEVQVAWEYRHLHLADLTVFWFPRCDPRLTVQPITLLELGSALVEARLQQRRIVLGADPGYPRRRDLELQLAHALPGMSVHTSLAQTVTAACHTLDLR